MNHLGNVLSTISDKKIGRDDWSEGSVGLEPGSDGVIDSYIAEVLSQGDYYPGGMGMPGRKYELTGRYYRFSINGQEKTPEIAPNTTTAEYWQYDARIVRRWNVDPVVKEYESSYMTSAGNPIWFSDPNGSDTTKPAKSTEQLLSESRAMLKELDKRIAQNARDISRLKQIDKELTQMSKDIDKSAAANKNLIDRTKDFIQNGKALIERTKQTDIDHKRRMAAIESETFWDYINPVDDVDVYVSVQVKKTVTRTIAGQNVSGTMVQYGLQGGYTTEGSEGFYGNFVTIDKSYLNYKLPGTTTEVRLVPANNGVNVPLGSQATYGDFRPTLRTLTTVGVVRGITIQTEFTMKNNSAQVGLRGKVETPKIAGYSLEAAAGVRVSLKTPQLFKYIGQSFGF